MLAVILISLILSSCTQNSEPPVAKIENTNQSLTASTNKVVSANNNVSASPLNTSTPVVNKNAKSSAPVKDPTPQIGSGGGDLLLFTQVRSALSSDKELINAVIVEVKEGSVTLSGKVSSETQKTKAAQLVQSVKGIKSVKNNLRISS